MTLTTKVRLIEPGASIEAVWSMIAELIGATPDARWNDDVDHWTPGLRRRMMVPGQGFDALVWVVYGADGPVPATLDTIKPEYAEDRQHYLDHPEQNAPAASYEISLDSGYAYNDDEERSATDLHNDMVATIGAWADAADITWWSRNEFIGAWRERAIPYGLADAGVW